jgi:exodeoxyribonuclease VII large subunit
MALYSENTTQRDIYSVSRLNREARILLETGLATLWLEGEISNFSRPGSGHWYFTLKDSAAQVRCAMFRSANLRVRVTPKDGLQVLIRGRVGLYESRGEFQLVAEHIEEAGEGALRRRFDELKARLAAEGLFDLGRKQALPSLPRRIGVITSPTGAAIRDILHVLKRRFAAIPVLIYPTAVQGTGAAAEIASMLRLANTRKEVDLLILARGGGSLEDLWAFNEEVVARAVAASDIPIITGIGHEVDTTIADFVADVRAPTPSGAAELAVPDRAEWLRAIANGLRRLRAGWEQRHQRAHERLRWLAMRLQRVHPREQLTRRAQRIDELEARLQRAANARFSNAKTRLGSAMRTLHAVSPLATLNRGYAIVIKTNGTIVKSTQELTLGETITARVGDGQVRAQITEILGNLTTK